MNRPLPRGRFCANPFTVNQSSSPPRIIVPEVLPAEEPRSSSFSSNPGRSSRVTFHPLAALALVIVDTLWSLPEFANPALIAFTVPLAFVTVFLSVFLAQRRHNGDARLSALWKGILLGLLAAIPTFITGTPVGLALLAWAGIKHPWRSP